MAKDFEITRVGAEPVVVWERDPEDDLPLAAVMMPGWRFEGPGGAYVEFGAGAWFSFTITVLDDVPLVPSDPEPDIEHGAIWLVGRSPESGWTLAELRAVAQANRQQRRASKWRRFCQWLGL